MNKSIEKYYYERASIHAMCFFSLFSRFEYALKKSDNLQNGKIAKASWLKFSSKLGNDFFERLIECPESLYLINNPPKKQMIVDNKLCWVAGDTIINSDTAFSAINTVRNNLFHGGKSDPLYERDLKLLEACLFILNFAFSYSEGNENLSKFYSAMEFGL